jgi:hypothetical protein
MSVPVTCRGGLHPPRHQLRLSIEYDCHRVEGRMQSAPTRLVCSLSEITLNGKQCKLQHEISALQ